MPASHQGETSSPDRIRAHARGLRADVPFWSVRWYEQGTERIDVRNDVVEPVRRTIDRGAMVTAVVEGGVGYAATSDCSLAGLQGALDRAKQWARTMQGRGVEGVTPEALGLAGRRGMAPPRGSLEHRRADLIDLLRAECAAARIDDRVVERHLAIEMRKVTSLIVSSDGADIEQSFHHVLPSVQVIAAANGISQARTWDHAQQGGIETLAQAAFAGQARIVADEALQLVAAPNCPDGRMDLLLAPDQMMLQIHESIGHPLELDRILGDERNYAGTSFVTPDMFGHYRYGSPLLNVTFDPTVAGELATYAFDDEGAEARKVWLIRDGLLERPLGGRLSQQRSGLPGTANARACGWNRPPIDRMANINVEPGASSFDEMVRSVRRGVYMRTNTSWSIDDSRNKFQFGCEVGQLIEDGQLKGLVRNPNYRGISATFWRNLRMVGAPGTMACHGTLYCGKGEPNQVITVGHAAPPCLFGEVDVFGGAS